MKQILNIFRWFAFFSICGVFSAFAFAENYQDDFNVLQEDNWELWGQFSLWKAEKGFLKGWIQSPVETFELFQFKGPGTYENYELPIGHDIIQRQIKNPGYDQFIITLGNLGINGANFGIAIGRLFPKIIGSNPFYYLFTTAKIYSARFSGWGGVIIPFKRWRKPHNPDTNWRTWELESMELRFNKGHFQWFANGEKRADFRDPEFSPIKIIGFVFEGTGFEAGHAWVDSFKISELRLAVSPRVKLATNWGRLKKQ